MKNPCFTIWTTSQYPYDQRIQRIAHTMRKMGEVKVYDRWTQSHPGGVIKIPYMKGPAMYLEYNRQISKLIGNTNCDLIYAADIDVMPGLMWGMKRSPHIPVLLDLHEWFPESIELERKPLKRAIWRQVESRSVGFVDGLMTVNQSLARIFQAKYHKDFEVVRNVPFLNPKVEIEVHSRLGNKILYYQGAINAGRGLEVAIHCLNLLEEWKLWLVGDGDISDTLMDLARNQGVEDRVVFWGRKSPDDLPGLAAQATVGLNLLDNLSQSYFYSLANKYFDYMHSALPSIHMNFPEYRYLMESHRVGELIEDLSPDDLAGAVQKLTRNSDRYVKIMDECILARKNYHWEKESKKVRTLLESILELPIG